MKLNLLLGAIVALFISLSAVGQVVYSEDFEILNLDDGISQQVPAWWTTWSNVPGTAEDPLVTTAYANGGSNSLLIGEGNDVVMTVGDLTENRYKMDFYLYVPVDRSAFYSPMQEFDPEGSVFHNGMQVFFVNGNATIDGCGESGVAEFVFEHDTWMHIVQYFDFDADVTDLFVNDELVLTGQWSLGINHEDNRLQGFDLFGWDGEATPECYYDDIVFEQVPSANPPTNLSLAIQDDFNILVSWDAPAEGTPDSYFVFCNEEVIGTVADGTTFLHEDLYPNIYEYQVKAYYGDAVGFSIPTDMESIEILGGNLRETVLLEVFTGIECDDASTISQAIGLLGYLDLNMAIINYHGQDDGYATPATISRSDYYTPYYDENDDDELLCPSSIVNGMDGSEGTVGTLIEQRNYYRDLHDEYIEIYSLYTIDVEVTPVTTIPYVFDISIDVEEISDYYGDDEIKLFVALTESNIAESWQGQTELDNVLRSMLPDGNGTILDFESVVSINEEFQLTLDAEYNIENCDLIIFVQNMENANIMEAYTMSLAEYVGIENNKTQAFSVYPNPTSDMVNIVAGEDISTITVFTLTGNSVMKVYPTGNITEISTQQLASGVYFIKIETAQGNSVKRLIVE